MIHGSLVNQVNLEKGWECLEACVSLLREIGLHFSNNRILVERRQMRYAFLSRAAMLNEDRAKGRLRLKEMSLATSNAAYVKGNKSRFDDIYIFQDCIVHIVSGG